MASVFTLEGPSLQNLNSLPKWVRNQANRNLNGPSGRQSPCPPGTWQTEGGNCRRIDLLQGASGRQSPCPPGFSQTTRGTCRRIDLLQGASLPDLLGVPTIPQLLGIPPALGSLLGFAGAAAVGVGLGMGAIWVQKRFKKGGVSGVFGLGRHTPRHRKQHRKRG